MDFQLCDRVEWGLLDIYYAEGCVVLVSQDWDVC